MRGPIGAHLARYCAFCHKLAYARDLEQCARATHQRALCALPFAIHLSSRGRELRPGRGELGLAPPRARSRDSIQRAASRLPGRVRGALAPARWACSLARREFAVGLRVRPVFLWRKRAPQARCAPASNLCVSCRSCSLSAPGRLQPRFAIAVVESSALVFDSVRFDSISANLVSSELETTSRSALGSPRRAADENEPPTGKCRQRARASSKLQSASTS